MITKSSPPPMPAALPAKSPRKRRPWVWIGVTVSLLFCGFIGFRIVQVTIHLRTHPSTPTPGSLELQAAIHQIVSLGGGTTNGNTEVAGKTATRIASDLRDIRQTLFTGGNPDSLDIKAITRGEFLVYCQMNQDTCAVLIHVPELRRFTPDAKKSIAELAYDNVCKNLDPQFRRRLKRLAVATRGNMLFDTILIGQTGFGDPDPSAQTSRVESLAVAPDQLRPFFVPATQPAPATRPQ